MVKSDRAASSHYWWPQDKMVLDQIENCLGRSILLPNNDLIAYTKKGQLPFINDTPTIGKFNITIFWAIMRR